MFNFGTLPAQLDRSYAARSERASLGLRYRVQTVIMSCSSILLNHTPQHVDETWNATIASLVSISEARLDELVAVEIESNGKR